jgi:hypothetical protein
MRRRPLPNRIEGPSRRYELEPWLANLIVQDVLEQLAWCEKGGCVHAGQVFRRCPMRASRPANGETAAS